MGKVVCIGESIVDIIPIEGTPVLTAGGAPVNVCACVSELGGHSCFLGSISTDEYGSFLYDEIKKCGIDTRYIQRDSEHKSAISVVSLANGDRSFEFFRENTADMFLSEQDVSDGMLEKEDILHFCSLCLVESPCKYAHKKAVLIAKKKGALVSFDLNMRPALWQKEQDMISAILEFLPYAHIIKMSDDELGILLQHMNCNGAEKESVNEIFKIATVCKLLVVTKGKNGCVAYDRSLNRISCSAAETNVVDTTGAGDCFIGSILYLISANKTDLSFDKLQSALSFASTACAMEITEYGGVRAMRRLKGLTFTE